MLKSKVPTGCLNAIKVAILCGVSLQLLQPAVAGWDKDVNRMSEIKDGQLATLKRRCNMALGSLRNQEDQTTEAFTTKKTKWVQRNARVDTLLDSIKADPFSTASKKYYLLEKDAFKNVLRNENPDLQIILSTQGEIDPGLLNIHVPSIFNAPSKIVSVVQNEVNEQYLRAMLAESGLSADEQESQLRSALNRNNNNNNNSSIIEPTFVDERQEEATESYLRAMLADTGLSAAEQQRQLSVMLAQNNRTSEKKTTLYTTTQTSAIPVTQEEVTQNYLEEFMTNAGFDEDQKKAYRRQAIALNGFHVVNTETTAVTNNSSNNNNNNSSQTTVTVPSLSPIELEMQTQGEILSMLGDSQEDKRTIGIIQARFQKLQNAHNLGVTSYASEDELNAYSQSTVTVPTFYTAQTIDELEGVLPLLGELGSAQDLQSANTRLAKLKAALARGVTAYSDESSL